MQSGPMSLLAALAPLVYIQVSPERIVLRNVKSGESISEPPHLAMARQLKAPVLAVGAEAAARATASVELVNPFGHPRTLVSDFTAGEQLLKALLRRLLPASMFAVSPRVVLHPLGDPEGGFTQIEVRALHEMALGAGAAEVRLWQGRPLTDEELLAGRFPQDGKLLN